MKHFSLKVIAFILAILIILSTFSMAIFAATTKYETIKDSVPVWSEPSSSSTKVYRIENEGTIVEISTSKTNNKGNLWYQLANDGNWIFSGNIAKHKHKAVMCGKSEASYEQRNSSEHIIITNMPELCSCGHVMTNIKTESIESHSFASNALCVCGYKKEHYHEAVMCGKAEYSYEQYNSSEHIITINTPNLCSCGHVMGYETTESIEAHDFDSNDTCSDCGFKKEHIHKAVMCGKSEYDYEQYNSSEHIVTISAPDLCSCGHVMGYETTESLEAHDFDPNDICSDCGFKKEHIHKAVMCGKAEYSYEQLNSSEHIVTISTPDLCSCSHVMGYETTESIEAHDFDSNDICSGCGFKKEHIHKAVMCGKAEYSYEQNNSSEHIVTISAPDLCSCGHVMGYETTESIEAHDFDSNDTCSNCGFKKEHKHKAVMCGKAEYSYEQLNSSEHIITISTPDLCSCGHVMSYETTESIEAHDFNSEKTCTKCGYTNHTHYTDKFNVIDVEYVVCDAVSHIVLEDTLELCACGSTINQTVLQTTTEHIFDSNGECICGYKKESSSHTHEEATSGTPTYSYSAKDLSVHYVTTKIPVLCECGSIINIDTKSQEESHNFVNGFCKECHIEKSVGIFDVNASQIIEQAIEGNYSDDVTIAGVVGEILVGEIPVVGTLADMRDLYYDIQNDASVAEIAIDTVALIPVAGSVIKYADEIVALVPVAGITVKYTDEVAGISDRLKKTVTKILNGGSDALKLSANNIQHIKKHTFEGMLEQSKHLSDEKLAQKLSSTTFFNKNWSQDQTVEYVQKAYDTLRRQGKTGKHSIKIKGEIITVVIKNDGTFDTAYGIYKHTVDDFR